MGLPTVMSASRHALAQVTSRPHDPTGQWLLAQGLQDHPFVGGSFTSEVIELGRQVLKLSSDAACRGSSK